jgi:hypothetical protein
MWNFSPRSQSIEVNKRLKPGHTNSQGRVIEGLRSPVELIALLRFVSPDLHHHLKLHRPRYCEVRQIADVNLLPPTFTCYFKGFMQRLAACVKSAIFNSIAPLDGKRLA